MFLELPAVASLVKIAAACHKGFKAIQGLQPEYGTFWDRFEARLKPEARDLPWTPIMALRLNPQFVGEACELVRGEHEARVALAVRFHALATPPPGSRYSLSDIEALLLKAADEAAVAAAKTDRKAMAQQTRLLSGQAGANHDEVVGRLSQIEAQLAEIGRRLSVATDESDAASTASHDPVRGGTSIEWRFLESVRHDPDVVAVVSPTVIDLAGFIYEPDFAVRDADGTSWLVELKLGSSPDIERAARLVDKAGRLLGSEWRAIVLTASDLDQVRGWRELTERGSRRFRADE